jgi:hypothetical protein
MRLPLLLLALVLLAGCSDLDTSYASTEGKSINGCSGLLAALEQRTTLRRAWQLSPRLDEGPEILVHLSPSLGMPDTPAITWLRTWLEAEDGRTCVLILRDGNLSPWLLGRWASEAESESYRVGGPAGEALQILAERCRARANAEIETPWPANGGDSSLFRVESAARQHPVGLSLGKSPLPVPASMTAGSRLAARDGTAVISARMPDGTAVPWMLSVPVGDSRLLVVANATPLLDGALPDKAARHLCNTVIDEILADHDGGEPPVCAWLASLRVRSGDPEPMNPVKRLLTTDPFRLPAWHALVLVLAMAAAGAIWLGRREPPPDRRSRRFGAHVDALGGHLRDGGHANWCVRTIARLRGLPPPPHLDTADDARRWLAETLERKHR